MGGCAHTELPCRVRAQHLIVHSRQQSERSWFLLGRSCKEHCRPCHCCCMARRFLDSSADWWLYLCDGQRSSILSQQAVSIAFRERDRSWYARVARRSGSVLCSTTKSYD